MEHNTSQQRILTLRQAVAPAVVISKLQHRVDRRLNPLNRLNRWQLASEGLDAAEKDVFKDVASPTQRVRIDHLLEIVVESQQRCESRKWVLYTSKSGQGVYLRDVFARFIRGIQTFKASIDTLVQCDVVGHAAIPWAVIQMCINVLSHDVNTYGDMLESMARISEIIARNSELEKQKFSGISELKNLLSASIVKLYRTILRYLVRARKYYLRSTASRILRSAIETSEDAIGKFMRAVTDAENEVTRLAGYVTDEDQSKRLHAIPRAVAEEVQRRAAENAASVDSRRKELLVWLNPVRNDDTLPAIIHRTQPNTCNWIFSNESFKEWTRFTPGKPSIFWIHGPPGFGKTFLSARLAQHYSVEPKECFASFFCLAEDEATRDPFAILRSWIADIVVQNDQATHRIFNVYSSRKVPDYCATYADLWKSIGVIGRTISPLTLLIDGYDECMQTTMHLKYHEEDGRVTFLKELLRNMKSTSIHVILISRETPEIASALSSEHCAEQTVNRYEHPITVEDTRSDVMLCSQEMIGQKFTKKFDKQTRSRIAVEAASKSEGMFLWLAMFGKSMKQWDSEEKLRQKIANMPTELEQIYEAELNRVLRPGRENNAGEMAKFILRWTLFAARPLTIRELAETMSLAPTGESPLFSREDIVPDDWNNIDTEYIDVYFKQPCGILIQLQSQGPDTPLWEQTVHFPHFSIKEFLLKADTKQKKVRAERFYLQDDDIENRKLAEMCLQYLCLDFLQTGREKNRDLRGPSSLWPFMSYSVEYWSQHASIDTGVAHELLPYIRKLFSPETDYWRVCSEVESGIDDDGETNVILYEDEDSAWQNSSPLCYAAYLGLTEIVADLIEQGLDCGCRGNPCGFPLYAAATRGHLQTIKLLVENGADINQSRWDNFTALHAAACVGSTEIAEYLISQGADVYATGPFNMTPFDMACSGGHVRLMELLFPNGDINAIRIEEQTPLSFAVLSGKLEAVTFLVNHGADIHNQVLPATTSLMYYACIQHNVEVLEYILNLGLDISTTLHGLTGFDIAVEQHNVNFVEVFIARGSLRDHEGHFAIDLVGIQIMALQDRLHELEETIDQLPDNKRAQAYMGALPAAAAGRASKTVSWLLQQSQPNSFYGLHGQTTLHIAVLAGSNDIVQMLLDIGHPCTIPNDFDALPVHQIACSQGMKGRNIVIELVIRGGLFAQTSTIISELSNGEKMSGTWSGTYTYLEERKGVVEPTSFTLQSYDSALESRLSSTFSPTPSTIRSLFYSKSSDEFGVFEIHGQILTPDEIAFVKLYARHGWLYHGMLSKEGGDRTFTGTWGSSPQLWHGTFEVKFMADDGSE